MKTVISFFSMQFIQIVLIGCFWFPGVVFSQGELSNGDGLDDILSFYEGWLNNPQVLKVCADETFTDDELACIQTAIDRWNAAGCKPALEMATDSCDITFTTNPSLGSYGLADPQPKPGKWESATIYINDRDDANGWADISFCEVATHELGHCLGLAHTDNPEDVMVTEGSNGSDGDLSETDISETAASALIWENESLKRGVDDPGVIKAGSTALCSFDLGQIYPDSVASTATITIAPVVNPYITIQSAAIYGHLLLVTVFVDPAHWNGMMFLDVDIDFQYPSYPAVHFIGWQYVAEIPVPPTTYSCSFEIIYENGQYIIPWTSTYPYGDVRSTLTVDDNLYFTKGPGPYTVTLEPGLHTLTLDVDDFQGNSATSSQTINVTGISTVQENRSPWVHPNPIHTSCLIENVKSKSTIEILDLFGNVVDVLPEGMLTWNPPPMLPNGIYLVRIIGEDESFLIKVMLNRE